MPRYAQYVAKKWYAQHLSNICPRHAQDMPNVCPKYTQDMAMICKSNIKKIWGKMYCGKMSTCFTEVGGKCLEAKCPWGKMSVGQNVLGAKCPLA